MFSQLMNLFMWLAKIHLGFKIKLVLNQQYKFDIDVICTPVEGSKKGTL